MNDQQELDLCEPPPFIFLDDGHLSMTDGRMVWLVVISPEAMTLTASPAKSALERLVRHAGFYKDLAAAAIRRSEDRDGKVWINAADILSARAALPSSFQGTSPARSSQAY